MNDRRVTAGDLLPELVEKDKQLVAVRVNGRVVDLHTPFEPPDDPKSVKPIRAGDPDGLAVIRHSTAHIMADAVQQLFPGTKVTIGPSTKNGFYYDFDKDGVFHEDDLAKIEAKMKEIASGKHPFTRTTISRGDVHRMFADMDETYKHELIDAIPEGDEISLYRHGAPESQWVDLCQGPHVPHTGFLRAHKLTSVAGAYWRGDESNPMLQRIYGTAFGSGGELRKHLLQLEQAKKRDHRKLGKELDLFMFHEYAPAMPFFLPRGAHIYNTLIDYVRKLYTRYGYDEVLTPQFFDTRLFHTSGHLPNYRPNMYMPATAEAIDNLAHVGTHGVAEPPTTDDDKDAATKASKDAVAAMERVAAKPMNCPSHCLIFGQKRRSYRELPTRIADFGRLHRYERGGVVHGLARVRSFCQDDGHIFCTDEQLSGEIDHFVNLLFEVYHAFNFERVDIKLATRPEKRIGTDEQWDKAEKALAESLDRCGLEYTVEAGEGAFYGPKLEFHIEDAIGRSWQLGTVQLDYANPVSFDLTYTGSDGKNHRPVMLHRAILGSLERFMAVYIEHTGGAFPVWIAPEQARVVTVSEKQDDYAREVVQAMRDVDLRVEADLSSDKLGAKIRSARLMRVPYILVVGDNEVEARSVSPRSRDLNKNLDALSLDDMIDLLVNEAKAPRLKKGEINGQPKEGADPPAEARG